MNIINGLLKFLASASYAIIYIYANELFPTKVRNTGMGICSMIARIGAIIGTVCNDSLVSSSSTWSLHYQLGCFRHAFTLICPFFYTVVRRCWQQFSLSRCPKRCTEIFLKQPRMSNKWTSRSKTTVSFSSSYFEPFALTEAKPRRRLLMILNRKINC